MQKSILLSLLLRFVFSGQLLADNENGEKSKQKEDKKHLVIIDSSMKGHIKHMINQKDDTLVFEDWDDPDIKQGDNSTIDDGGSYGNGGINADKVNHLVGDVLAAHRKEKYKAEFQIFPNPAVSVLHLRLLHEPSEVRIINLSGESIQVEQVANQIDVSSLSRGIYFIQLVYPDHIESKKFVKS